MARKVEEIQQEYGQVCAANGERAFQIEVMKAEIEKGTQRIIALGKEMQEAQAALKPTPVVAPTPEVVSSETAS